MNNLINRLLDKLIHFLIGIRHRETIDLSMKLAESAHLRTEKIAEDIFNKAFDEK
jgi:hypothetical protein